LDKFLLDYTLDGLKTKLEKKPYKPFLKYGDEYYHEYKGLQLINNEIFCEYPMFLELKVSNMGRVMFKNEILPQKKESEEKYDYLSVTVPGYSNFIYVYKLVAETFLLKDNPDREKYKIIHHISNNGFDNRVINLLYVTKEQHDKIHCFGCLKQ
jgi:hypothetical protein